jgi:hypothetical protein
VKKYIAVGEMIVFCVVFCRSVIVLFLLAIALPTLALGDLKTLLALFLKQQRVRKFTWLDPIQCETHTCTIFNRVQCSLKTRVQSYVIRQQMKQKKTRVQFKSLNNKWSKQKPRTCNFTLPLQALGPIGYDCHRSLWNKIEKRYWKYQNKIYYVHFRPLYRPCLPSYYATLQIKDTA